MKDVEFTNFKLSDTDKKIIEKDKIKYKKKINQVVSKARRSSKKSKCLICGREVDGFCNSHSIPAFCLKQIANQGKVYYSNKLIDLPFMDTEKGIKNAGTFHLICQKCDNTIFQTYENPINYNDKISGKMLAEIAMKNYLKRIDKRNMELEMPKAHREFGNNYPVEIERLYEEAKTLDLKEDLSCFHKAKRLIQKEDNTEYYLFSRIKLDYTVPIAFQGIVALIADLDGTIINYIYNKNCKYKMAYLHICIFPFESKTEILMFIENTHKRYRKFYKRFNKLSLESKLSIINYIIFLYTEDYFISKSVGDDIIKNESLRNVSIQSFDALVTSPGINPIEEAKKIFDLNNHDTIPNILSIEFAIKNDNAK